MNKQIFVTLHELYSQLNLKQTYLLNKLINMIIEETSVKIIIEEISKNNKDSKLPYERQ